MDSILWTLLLIIGSILVYFYLEIRRKFRYWKDRGVVHETPLFFFGHSLPQITGKISFADQIYDFYNNFPAEKVVGMYAFTRPNLLIRDINLLEKILVRDFHFFSDHNPPPVDTEPLGNNGLFNLTGNRWRGLRHKIAPTFTSGKLKIMFEQMLTCSDNLLANIKRDIKDDYDIKDVLMSYAIDVTSNVIFGMELKEGSVKEEYKNKVLSIFDVKFYQLLTIVIAVNFPNLAKRLGMRFIQQGTEDYFRNIIKDTFQQRTESNYKRNDYVQMLLALKEKGYLEVRQKDPEDDYLKTCEEVVAENFEISDDLLTAQAFQFLTGGFDALYSTIQLLLFELSKNRVIQDLVRLEVKECLKKNGSYTYKALKNMEYLERCIQETLRLYPSVPFLVRICVKDYQTDDGLIIEGGTTLLVSLLGLHRDPNYFPNPEKFDPDRFHPDAAMKNYTYLPFGDGPRMCIGMRFAMMEMKLAVAKILENYDINLSPKTELPLKLNKRTLFLKPMNLYFHLKKII